MEMLHIILPNGDAADACEALDDAGVKNDYLNDYRILVDENSDYEDVLDDAGIKWDNV